MSNGLTYLSLRCVLEYLDALKRIPITLRSRVLQRIDNSIPLRVKNINIQNTHLIIDTKSLQSYAQYEFWLMTDDEVKREERRRAEVMKELFVQYLRGKSNIYVDKVLFNKVNNLETVQVKIPITANKLSAYLCNIADLNMMISSPLQELCLNNQPFIVDYPIVHTARSLILKSNKRGISVPGIEKLPNKKVLVIATYDCSRIERLILRIIRYWMKNGKDVGTEYLFELHYNVLGSILQRFLRRFYKFQDLLEEVDDQFHPEAPRFLIPINGTSLRIQVYVRVKPDDRRNSTLVLSVVEV
ncbi:hypothetical protein GCK72_008003 [Caenorhabditis remanei]|uniref:F-box C protein n=1 Tax=Caenorhabditis remanei TaxID=31234 RepID=A0A6A5HQF8_CAERE|nr:hypothetical protein GCK72_008003 [Caenorhabditis remanei]KAF1768042.1 hypothetical protein GCK72_008003 [Caenorhabditis remanei]